MDLAFLRLANPDDRIDRQKGRETSDRGRERSQHAQIRAIIAIFGIERIADETAIAGPGPKQADLTLELDRGGRQ